MDPAYHSDLFCDSDENRRMMLLLTIEQIEPSTNREKKGAPIMQQKMTVYYARILEYRFYLYMNADP